MKAFHTFLFQLFVFISCAQQVSNIRSAQEGKQVVITYDISDGNRKTKFDIKLFYSQNNKEWKEATLGLRGDIGKGITSGKNKTINWSPLSELSKLTGNGFSFKVKAIVTGNRKKNQPDGDNDGTPDIEDNCPDIPGPEIFSGCPDADEDGVPDNNDLCLYEKGLLQFHGCPDRDSDGVIDKLDECPGTPGEKEFNGCPDRDKDGTPDKTDMCPDVPGPKDHFGCPDTDGDGIYDNEDKCIQTPGPKENAGCPWPDKDGDGVFDKDDSCPTIPGLPENKGCPKLEKKELETIKYAFENLEFETGKDIIRTSSYPSLNSLADLLKKKSNYGLKIEGHTDNVGNDEKNMILSQKRADAVKNYLTKKGVSSTYLETYGYGASKPIASNETSTGRQKNCRVEMTITFH